MTNTHVVSALKEKRIRLASEIESLQARVRQTVIDLDHVEATLKQFDPAVKISELGPRKVPQVLTDIHGDTGRVILDTLRNATTPVKTSKICEAVMKARGYHRVLKVARTIADLAASETIARSHVAEALSFRRIAHQT